MNYHYIITLCLAFFLHNTAWPETHKYLELDWKQLIPTNERNVPSRPTWLNGLAEGSYRSLEEALLEKAKKEPLSKHEQAYFNALTSHNTNSELFDKNIRISGYLVPIEYNEERTVTEFFLVPYFGACIHEPPPPPNQTIYVKYPKGIFRPSLYKPYQLIGQLKEEVTDQSLATSAYSINAEAIEVYDRR